MLDESLAEANATHTATLEINLCGTHVEVLFAELALVLCQDKAFGVEVVDLAKDPLAQTL